MTSTPKTKTPGVGPAGNDVSTPGDGGSDVLSSIAALKNILMIDTPTRKLFQSQQTATLQQRYEENQANLQTIAEQRTRIQELETLLRQSQEEGERERQLHQNLQKSYDSLVDHKRDMSKQLEFLRKSRAYCENKANEHEKALKEVMERSRLEAAQLNEKIKSTISEKEKALDQQSTLEAKLLSSNQLVEELKADKETLKKQMNADQLRHEAAVERHNDTKKTLQKQLQDVIGSREEMRKVVEGLRAELEEKTRQASASASDRQTIQALQEQLKVSTAKCEDLQKQMEDMRHTVVAQSPARMFDRMLEKKEAEIESTKQELEELKNEKQELEEKVKTLQGRSETTETPRTASAKRPLIESAEKSDKSTPGSDMQKEPAGKRAKH